MKPSYRHFPEKPDSDKRTVYRTASALVTTQSQPSLRIASTIQKQRKFKMPSVKETVTSSAVNKQQQLALRRKSQV